MSVQGLNSSWDKGPKKQPARPTPVKPNGLYSIFPVKARRAWLSFGQPAVFLLSHLHVWPSPIHTSSSWSPSSCDDALTSQLRPRLPPTLLQLVSCSKWTIYLAQDTPSIQQVTRRSFPMQSCPPCTAILLFSTATRRPVRTSLHQTTHAPHRSYCVPSAPCSCDSCC